MQLSNLWVLLAIILIIVTISKTMDFFWALKKQVDELHMMLKLQEKYQIDKDYLEFLKNNGYKDQQEKFEKYLKERKSITLAQIHRAYMTLLNREEND